MTAVVVDTCVVSFLLKNDTRAELYRPHLDVDTKIISFMTLAELYRWSEVRDWGEDRKAEDEGVILISTSDREFVFKLALKDF